jgi:L-fucose isomerase-like protein
MRFAAVANVVKRYRNMRILQISTRPTPFMSVICNEGEMLEQFGAETIPVALDDLLRLADTLKKAPTAEVEEAAKLIRSLAKAPTITDDNVLTMAAIKAALKQLILSNGCCCAAVQCWDAFYRISGVMPCIAHSLLADECIPVACETDIMGAMSAALLQAANFDRSAQFFADITVRHPTDDNAELLWHCGPFPYSLRKTDCDPSVIHSYTLKDREPGFCNWQLKDGDITVIRLDGDHGKYQMFIGEAVTTEGPHNQGTYVWIKTGNWPSWERKLVEGPFIHHVTGCYGHYGEILAEACKYFNNVEVCFAENGQQIMRRWG